MALAAQRGLASPSAAQEALKASAARHEKVLGRLERTGGEVTGTPHPPKRGTVLFENRVVFGFGVLVWCVLLFFHIQAPGQGLASGVARPRPRGPLFQGKSGCGSKTRVPNGAENKHW